MASPTARNDIDAALSTCPADGLKATTTRAPESTVYVPFDRTTSVSPTFTDASSAPAISGIVMTVCEASTPVSAESATSSPHPAYPTSVMRAEPSATTIGSHSSPFRASGVPSTT